MRHRKEKPKQQSKEDQAFERETKRRRAEMLRNIAGRVGHIPKSTLRLFNRRQRKLLMQKPPRKPMEARA